MDAVRANPYESPGPAVAPPARRWSLRLGATAVILGAMSVAYIPLSLHGDYVLANHGGAHWTKSWCPAHLFTAYTAPSGRPKRRPTVLGILFSPFVLADRSYWHIDRDPFPLSDADQSGV